MDSDCAILWKAKLEALLGPRWAVRCSHVFLAEELAQLREGLWPRDVDDRWVVWLDGGTLRCWRSWTGTCIYETKVAVSEDGTGVAAMLDVLDDPDSYRRAGTDAGELERFESVLPLVWRREDEGDALAGVSVLGG